MMSTGSLPSRISRAEMASDVLRHLRDLLVHDGLEGVRVAGVHVRGGEHDGVLGALHLDVGAKAAVGDGRLEPLLVIRGVDREEIGHGVQRQLVRQNLLQAGADEGVPDHRGVLGA